MKRPRKQATHHLRSRPTLHKRLPSRIPRHSLDIIIQPRSQTSNRQNPKQQPERKRDSLFERRRFALEVKAYQDGDGDDGHVRREAEPGEECWGLSVRLSLIWSSKMDEVDDQF